MKTLEYSQIFFFLREFTLFMAWYCLRILGRELMAIFYFIRVQLLTFLTYLSCLIELYMSEFVLVFRKSVDDYRYIRRG